MTSLQIRIPVSSEDDILKARRSVRNFIIVHNLSCSEIKRLHILTIVSELSRNIYKYAGKGEVLAEVIKNSGNIGLKLQFIDNGPGIPNIEEAMKPKDLSKGHTGLGLGLIGSKRLSDEFIIETASGKGTKITSIIWL